jgi:hypothetical protein
LKPRSLWAEDLFKADHPISYFMHAQTE